MTRDVYILLFTIEKSQLLYILYIYARIGIKTNRSYLYLSAITAANNCIYESYRI